MKFELVQRLIQKNYVELQFRLGHKVLGKKSKDWEEIDYKEMSLSEWEDLKDLCLSKNEKINLETTGFVKGISTLNSQMSSQMNSVRAIYSFMEWKENFKAHIQINRNTRVATHLQNLSYWESIRKPGGLHFVIGRGKSGKSQFLTEILEELKKDSPQMCATHADLSPLKLAVSDTLMHFGAESLSWSKSHAIYDGVDRLFVDLNDLTQLEKWIEFSEQGRWVVLTMSAGSIQNALEQIYARVNSQPFLWKRFCFQLSSMLCLSGVVEKELTLFESLILVRKFQTELAERFSSQSMTVIAELMSTEKANVSHSLYQNLNQSILQALLKRQLDVSLAFQHSNDPEQLDQMLKKMGL